MTKYKSGQEAIWTQHTSAHTYTVHLSQDWQHTSYSYPCTTTLGSKVLRPPKSLAAWYFIISPHIPFRCHQKLCATHSKLLSFGPPNLSQPIPPHRFSTPTRLSSFDPTILIEYTLYTHCCLMLTLLRLSWLAIQTGPFFKALLLASQWILSQFLKPTIISS